MFHLGQKRRHCDDVDHVLSFATLKLEAVGLSINEFPPGFVDVVIRHVGRAICDMTHLRRVPWGLLDVWAEIVFTYLGNVYAIKRDIADEAESEDTGDSEEASSNGDIKRIRRFTLGDLTVEGYATIDSGSSASRKAWVKANIPDLNETISNFKHRICLHTKFIY